MAFKATITGAPFGAKTLFKSAQTLNHAKDRFVAWNKRRQTENQLRKLTRRELEDIGIEPGGISSFVDQMKL